MITLKRYTWLGSDNLAVEPDHRGLRRLNLRLNVGLRDDDLDERRNDGP
jgi:hypothetical protein